MTVSFQPSVDSAVLQLTPSINQICLATLSLLRRYNWREFAVITGTMPGHDYFVNVLRDLVDRAVKDMWYAIDMGVLQDLTFKTSNSNRRQHPAFIKKVVHISTTLNFADHGQK
jgi:hypothetical protein